MAGEVTREWYVGFGSHNEHRAVHLCNHQIHSPSATIAMEELEKALGSAVRGISDQGYAQSLEFYRSWIDIGQTYYTIPPTSSLTLSGRIERRVRQFPEMVGSSTRLPT